MPNKKENAGYFNHQRPPTVDDDEREGLKSDKQREGQPSSDPLRADTGESTKSVRPKNGLLDSQLMGVLVDWCPPIGILVQSCMWIQAAISYSTASLKIILLIAACFIFISFALLFSSVFFFLVSLLSSSLFPSDISTMNNTHLIMGQNSTMPDMIYENLLPTEWLRNYTTVNITLYQTMPETMVATSNSLDRFAQLIPISNLPPEAEVSLDNASKYAKLEHKAVEKAYRALGESARHVATTWPLRASMLVERFKSLGSEQDNTAVTAPHLKRYINSTLVDLRHLRFSVEKFLRALGDEEAAIESLGSELRLTWQAYNQEVILLRHQRQTNEKKKKQTKSPSYPSIFSHIWAFSSSSSSSDNITSQSSTSTSNSLALTAQGVCQRGTHIRALGKEYQTALRPVQQLQGIVESTIARLEEIERSLVGADASCEQADDAHGVQRDLSVLVVRFSKAAVEAAWWPAAAGCG